MIIRLRALVAGAILLSGMGGCAAASPAAGPWTGDVAYAWAPGDTLRYRLTTEWSSSMAMSPDRTQRRRQARIALASAAEGRATAWIEQARLETPGANTPVTTAGPELVGRRFVLAVGRLGIDSMVAGDSVPRRWSDLVPDLDSLLPRLPGGALPAGRTWGESKSTDLSPSDTTWTTPQTRHVRYRVVGDSTIRRVAVVVVEYSVSIEREVRRRRPPPLPPPGQYIMLPSVVSTVNEEERGRFYFDARSGRLVRRTRTVQTVRQSPTYTSAEAAVLTEEQSETLELVSATARSPR